jgi:hypothetical protein
VDRSSALIQDLRDVRVLSIALLACLAAGAPPGAAAPGRPEAAPPAPPAPSAPPPLGPAMSTGTARLGALTLQLELGRWTVEALDRLIRDARAGHADPNERVAFLADHFRGTPFEYESLSPPPPAGTLRVRFDRFGCTGFVIAMLALNGARDFEELAGNLARIRYWRSAPGAPAALDSDPASGNILDFAWEVFIDSAVGQGFATDVTAEVAHGAPLTPFRSRFTARRRAARHDPDERVVIPRVHPDRIVTAKMLAQPDLARMDRSRIRSGDVLLFTHVDPARPVGDELLIGHVAIALNVDGEIYMVHATRDYVWRPTAGRDSPPIATGIYYGDPRREQLGVALATAWTTDRRGQELRTGGDVYHGYDRGRLRPVHDYMAGAGFRGVMVLRPTNRPRPEPRRAAP